MTTFSHERALPERLALNHLAINRAKEIVMNNILFKSTPPDYRQSGRHQGKPSTQLRWSRENEAI